MISRQDFVCILEEFAAFEPQVNRLIDLSTEGWHSHSVISAKKDKNTQEYLFETKKNLESLYHLIQFIKTNKENLIDEFNNMNGKKINDMVSAIRSPKRPEEKTDGSNGYLPYFAGLYAWSMDLLMSRFRKEAFYHQLDYSDNEIIVAQELIELWKNIQNYAEQLNNIYSKAINSLGMMHPLKISAKIFVASLPGGKFSGLIERAYISVENHLKEKFPMQPNELKKQAQPVTSAQLSSNNIVVQPQTVEGPKQSSSVTLDLTQALSDSIPVIASAATVVETKMDDSKTEVGKTLQVLTSTAQTELSAVHSKMILLRQSLQENEKKLAERQQEPLPKEIKDLDLTSLQKQLEKIDLKKEEVIPFNKALADKLGLLPQEITAWEQRSYAQYDSYVSSYLYSARDKTASYFPNTSYYLGIAVRATIGETVAGAPIHPSVVMEKIKKITAEQQLIKERMEESEHIATHITELKYALSAFTAEETQLIVKLENYKKEEIAEREREEARQKAEQERIKEEKAAHDRVEAHKKMEAHFKEENAALKKESPIEEVKQTPKDHDSKKELPMVESKQYSYELKSNAVDASWRIAYIEHEEARILVERHSTEQPSMSVLTRAFNWLFDFFKGLFAGSTSRDPIQHGRPELSITEQQEAIHNVRVRQKDRHSHIAILKKFNLTEKEIREELQKIDPPVKETSKQLPTPDLRTAPKTMTETHTTSSPKRR